MKNITVLSIAIIALFFSVSVSAHDENKHKGKPIEGVITDELDNNSYTLLSEDKTYSILLDANTKIENDGKVVSRELLKPSSTVKLFGTKLPGQKIMAKEILIQSNPEEGAHHHQKASNSSLLNPYIDLSSALANDSLEDALKAYKTFKTTAAVGDDNYSVALNETLSSETPDSLKGLRERFASISEVLIPLIKSKGIPSEILQVHCPMANNGSGASWLQRDKEIRNPYFGAAMLSCGEVKS